MGEGGFDRAVLGRRADPRSRSAERAIEDSLRPFDYGAVVVQMPDATVVITQPPHAADMPAIVREAANHLVRRQ